MPPKDSTTPTAAEATARDLLSRHEALLAFSNSIVGEVDADGRLIYISPSLYRVTGQRPEDLIGSIAYDHVHPDYRALLVETVENVIHGRAREQAHIRFLWPHSNGEHRLIDMHGVRHERADGRIVMVFHSDDITSEQTLVSELRASEQRLERAFDATGLGLWELDLETGRYTSDAAYEHLLGYAAGEMIGDMQWPQRYMHEHDQPQVAAAMQALVSGAQPFIEFEARVLDKAGAWCWLGCRAKVDKRDENGRSLSVLGTAKNIHAEVLARQAAEQANQRIALLLESTGEGICGLDEQGSITFANRAAERLLGCSRKKLIGQPFGDIILDIGDSHDSLEQFSEALLNTGRRMHQMQGHFRRENAGSFPVEFSVSPVLNGPDQNGSVVVFQDESRNRRLADRLVHNASHDMVTGLTNRQAFEARLEALITAGVKGQTTHALFYIDLDQFRVINATCGHTAGDQLLKQLAELIRNQLGHYRDLARLGGDEFGVLLENIDLTQAEQRAAALRREIANFSFEWGERIFHCGVCIGVVAIDASADSAGEIMAAADAACIQAKEAGRNRIHVATMSDPAVHRLRDEMRWAARNREALDNNLFLLHSQPIVPVSPGESFHPHVEVFVRMQGSNGEIIPPAEFLPSAEKHFLMPEVDRWVLRQLITWLAEQPDNGLRYSVNLSGSTLSDQSLLEEIIALLEETGVAPQRLCFEITETAAVANLTSAMRLINGLRELGCQFALDDFGTGMSSLTYLRQLPVDYVKIDGAFVRDMLSDSVGHAIVQAVHDVARQLGIRTVAEHVESQDIFDELKSIGIDYAQGFHCGRPGPIQASSSLH